MYVWVAVTVTVDMDSNVNVVPICVGVSPSVFSSGLTADIGCAVTCMFSGRYDLTFPWTWTTAVPYLYVMRLTASCALKYTLCVICSISASGDKPVMTILLHTVTSWVGSGLCTHLLSGLGVSAPTEIKGFRPFLVCTNIHVMY